MNKRSPKTLVPSTLALALGMAFALPASADGLGLTAPSASGLGTAYAGSGALAENASVQYFNPAALTLLPTQVSLGVVGVKSKLEFSKRGGDVGSSSDAGETIVLPDAYMNWALAPQWRLGLAVTTGGFKTDYGSGWDGAALGYKSRLKVTTVSPSAAYKLSDQLSLGFGLDYQRLKLDTYAAGPGKFSEDDGGWGWHAGLLWSLSDDMRIGLAYRSAIRHDLGSGMDGSPAFPGLGINSGNHIKTPQSFTLSVWQQVTPDWQAMGDLSYTRWSDLSDDAGTPHDSWRVAWGAIYKINDKWSTKFGLAYEKGVYSDPSRTLFAPDANRTWFSLGAQYRPWDGGVFDLGYAYQWVKDARIDQSGDSLQMDGRYDQNRHLLGLQYTQSF
jgi:long-chain fatty acid transport protein